MPEPAIDPNDLAEIAGKVEHYPDEHPRNADGTFHGLHALTPEMARGIVNMVLHEFTCRGYAIMKPEEV